MVDHTPEQKRKLAMIQNQIAPAFLEATKDTGHEWKRSAETGAVSCALCSTDAKNTDAALKKCEGAA